jgi:hypothetical protein
MRTLMIIAIAASTLAPTLAADNNAGSADWAMPGCRNFIKENLVDRFRQGVCVGTIRAIVKTDPQVCPPQGSTGGQGARIVAEYIDAIPTRMQEDFEKLAQEALRKAWPCH